MKFKKKKMKEIYSNPFKELGLNLINKTKALLNVSFHG